MSDLDKAIDKANARSYALASYAFTGSAEIAERLADEIKAGGVKDSGIGYEGGLDGIDAYLHKNLISRSA